MQTVAPSVPDELRDVLDCIDAPSVLFVDASALADDPDDHPGTGSRGSLVSLADMTDGHRAAGNCRPATFALNAHLSTLGYTTSTVQAFFDSGASEPGHVATAVTLPDGTHWVLDYTARQFDPTAPVPFVLPAYDWMALLADWAQTWGWRLRDAH